GFMNPDGAWISLSNTGVADGSWHQVAVTVRRPIDVTYYIDGRADGIIPMTSTTAYTFSGSIFRIGGYNYFVNGSIDDVRLFSAAIPVYQIQQSYFAGLNKLFAKNIINQEDYNNRLAGLNQNTAKN
ncbi:MAG: LamG-like jellyroll fold domain-containing protein, partial [Candidatus Paceibacterota bacterium]